MRPRRGGASICGRARLTTCWNCSPSPARPAGCADAAGPLPGPPPHPPGSRPGGGGGRCCRTCAALLPGPPTVATPRAEPGRRPARCPHGRAGWGGAPFVLAALDTSNAASDRGVQGLEAPAGVGGGRAAAAPPPPSGDGGRSAPAPGRDARAARPNSARPRRTMPGRRRRPSLPASGATHISCSRRRAPARARRSGMWPRPASGPRRTGGGLARHVHAPSAAPDRRRTDTPVPRRGGAAAAGRRAQGARELSLPAEP